MAESELALATQHEGERMAMFCGLGPSNLAYMNQHKSKSPIQIIGGR